MPPWSNMHNGPIRMQIWNKFEENNRANSPLQKSKSALKHRWNQKRNEDENIETTTANNIQDSER